MMGLVPFWEETLQLSLSLPCEGTAISQPSANQEESSHQKVNIARTLILDFPASRTVRNKYVLFKPQSLWYFVIAAQAD